MFTIYVNNITANDVRNNLLRILVKNKHLFPAEIKGIKHIYELDFKYEGTDYKVTYSIGSRDGKSRSGVLRLNNALYHKIGIQEGSRITITKKSDGTYTINKL